MSLKFGRYSFSGTSLNELDFSNLNHFANITFETSSFEEAVLKNGLNFSNLDNLTEVVFGDCSFKFYSGGIKCNNIKNLKTLSFGCSAFENSELDQVPFTIKQGETTCPNSCVYNDYIFIQSIHTVNIGKLAFWESFEDIPHPKKDSKFTPIRLYTGENISDKHIDDFTGIECIPFSYKSKEDLKDKLDFLYRLYEYGILGINCVDKLCRDIFIGDVKLLVENINNKNSELFDKGKPYMPEAQEKIKEFWDKIKI